jgi:putative ABC transport system permease protein
VCVIGAKVSRELFAGENPLGKTLHVGEWRFRVIGVLEPRGESLGIDFDDLVDVPVAAAMKMFDQRSLFRVIAQVRSHDEIEAAKDAGLALLRERHGGVEDVTALTQDSVLTTFSQILGMLTLALGGITAISLSVAGIGIMNVMLVSVSERVREIGLLKAIGATPRQILFAFLTEAAVLSTAGGVLGVAAGFAAIRAVVRVWPALPAAPPHWAVAGSLVLAVLVGPAFGALPARRAARLDPVAALAGR